MMAKKQSFFNSTFARTALPMFGFVLLCWYGLDQLMSSKLKIRVSSLLWFVGGSYSTCHVCSAAKQTH